MLLRLIAIMLLCIVTANTPAFGVQPNVKTGDNYFLLSLIKSDL
jgi:hypothetical protein